MANQIKMAIRDSIYGLYDVGWSQRRIAQELGLDRETVGRHLRLRAAEAAEPAKVPAGIEAVGEANQAILPPGTDASKPAIPPTGNVGRRSTCAGYDEAIREGIAIGLTAQRIFQDLRTDRGFNGSYDAVNVRISMSAALGI